MYKNLNPASLGVSGRQSELIELTLTYGFRGLDLDAADFLKRATLQGVDEAGKYIRSAKIKIGGWILPVQFEADDGVFQTELDRLAALTEPAKKLGFAPRTSSPPATNCRTTRTSSGTASDCPKWGMC